MWQKIQKIGNVVILIAVCCSIGWMRYDYQKKLNYQADYIDEQVIGLQRSFMELEQENALLIKHVQDDVKTIAKKLDDLRVLLEKKK